MLQDALRLMFHGSRSSRCACDFQTFILVREEFESETNHAFSCLLLRCKERKIFENLKIYGRVHMDVRREKQHTAVLTF